MHMLKFMGHNCMSEWSPPLSPELIGTSKAVGEDALKYLGILKQEKPGSGAIASGANDVQKSIRSLGRLAGVS